MQLYLDNLSRLGLLSIDRAAGDTGLGVAELQMEDEEYVWGPIRRYMREMKLSELREVSFQGTIDMARLTVLGREFCAACFSDDSR